MGAMHRVSIVATGLVLGAIAVAWAAQPLGTISGVITDTTGRGVPGVTIAVVSENSERRMMGTDSVGRYRLDGLMPGRYTVDASMDGFDTKRTEIPISSERDVVWSGALLLGPAIGEASIERRVMRFTGSRALDCGRHGTAASEAALRRSLTCGLMSARTRQPFSVIVQFTEGGTRVGHGLLAGADGVIHVFQYDKGGTKLRLEECPSPRLTRRHNRSGARFEFACQGDDDVASASENRKGYRNAQVDRGRPGRPYGSPRDADRPLVSDPSYPRDRRSDAP